MRGITGEPGDRCPYSAPVRRFTDCPAFAPAVYPAADSRGAPLKDVVSCAWLAVGRVDGEGRFYPRCSFGQAFLAELELGLDREGPAA